MCGTNADGQPTVACFAPGAYAAGSGRLLIINDVDSWTTQATFSPLNANGIFALNGTRNGRNRNGDHGGPDAFGMGHGGADGDAAWVGDLRDFAAEPAIVIQA